MSTTNTTNPPIECIFGDSFRSEFRSTNNLASYLSFIPMVLSIFVFSRAFILKVKWWPWWVISLLIGLQSSTELIFASSFICTTSSTPYIQEYSLWNLWYSILLVLSSAQGLVDMLWILVYNEAYINKKNEVDGKKARSIEEKENLTKENDKQARCYRIFYGFLVGLNVLLGITLVVCIYLTKKNGTYDMDGFSTKTVKFWVVIGSTAVNLV
jgi:hypothetical protein